MSSQPPPTPPASAFHGHPHGLLPRMLGVWNLEFRRVEGTAWRRWLTFWRPGHILGQVETSRAESPSPPNTTCVVKNPSRPHQLHSLQLEFGDTKICREQERLRFSLWFPREEFWPHKELGDRQAQHRWKAGCCGSLWSNTTNISFFPQQWQQPSASHPKWSCPPASPAVLKADKALPGSHLFMQG